MIKHMYSACAVALLSSVAVAQTPPPQRAQTPPATQQPQAQSKPAQLDQAGLRELQALQLIFYTVQPADALVSNLIGTDVYNSQNESVGEIEDAIIDKGKTLRALIVSVGGVLGLGERYVAVDPKSLIVNRDANGNMWAYVNSTKETLKNAPEFKYEGAFRRAQAGVLGTGVGTTGSKSGSQPQSAPPAQDTQQKR